MTTNIDQPGDDKPGEKAPPEILVTVTGQRFELSGADVATEWQMPLRFGVPAGKKENPYRSLQERSAENLDDIGGVENQIVVFWFVGIHRLDGDELQLALKYCGQGLEGDYFRDFRPPLSFDDEPMEDEVRLTLRRKNKQGR